MHAKARPSSLGLMRRRSEASTRSRSTSLSIALACQEAETSSGTGQRIASGNNGAQAARLAPSCAGMGRDHVILWTAPAAGTYRFDTVGSGLDTVLALYGPQCLEELHAMMTAARASPRLLSGVSTKVSR